MGNRSRKKILFVFGTRPEAIKLAPVILRMKRDRRFSVKVCVTGQHRQMLDQVLKVFKIKPDYDLNIMRPGQNLFEITTKSLLALDVVLRKEKPDMVLVQGDTSSTFTGSLAAFYLKIPVGHIEAGLRTDNKYQPFPEEINRRMTGVIAEYHFAPTENARINLMREGVSTESITVTGNTAIDALLYMKRCISSGIISPRYFEKNLPFLVGAEKQKVVLVTAHRRESFGEGMKQVCGALREISLRDPGILIVFPVHFNPNVRKPVLTYLSGLPNVHLLDPLPYELFVYLMMRSSVILTDSGGVQEEAPSLRRPVLVMRDVTERTEAIASGAAILVGTKQKDIVDAALRLLNDRDFYRGMTGKENPYGDGKASERILRTILNVQ